MHSPDPSTPIEDTVDGMQLVYASGRYKHVGHICLVQCKSVSALKLIRSKVRSVEFPTRGCKEGI